MNDAAYLQGCKALALAILEKALLEAKEGSKEAFYWLFSDEAKFFYQSLEITESTWMKIQDKITDILERKGL